MTGPNISLGDGSLDCDVLVVGAGFAGLYAVYAARRLGHSVVGIEAGDDVGGTWYWNRYPGARCDVESIDYSYSFDAELQRDWRWTERYATQPEILAYARHVADRFKLRRHYRFNERVAAASFDEAAAAWTVQLAKGDRLRARWIIFAAGSLSTPIRPDISGIDDFAGEMLFTARWPEERVTFDGKRVGIIGTGASGIQCAPIIAQTAAKLTVFQRSPNYSVPAFNRALPDDEWAEIQASYSERRRQSFASGGGSPHEVDPREIWDIDEGERASLFENGWKKGGVLFAKIFPKQTMDERVNALARDFAEKKIRAIVRDESLADDLIPTDHAIGTKRICTDSGYFETFNRDNVELVNLRRDPIIEITERGVRTRNASHDLDMLIFATGFDAMTGTITRVDFRGPGGQSMAEAWADGPKTMLGLMVPGFPNLFNITGPGSPSVLTNMILGAEQHVNWALGLMSHTQQKGYTMVEARRDAADAWTAHVDAIASATLFTQAKSWYMGANVDGKKRTFMPYIGGFAAYIRECEAVREEGYKGFVFAS
ncbi:MAG: NAD(P)/FAD-dependent oxidoreductase [Rhizobiaceae bacterium]|nr:NAD(P)/FAD-dependent oxidoreductase [Rhizobiaceae bacterium]